MGEKAGSLNPFNLVPILYTTAQLARKYIRYFLSACNAKGHGIHSPFVYDFTRSVLNDKREQPYYREIEEVRKKLLADKTIIRVEDFGAGSTSITSNNRAVQRIAASSLKSRKFARLLSRMVRYYLPSSILEIGTSFGITTSYLAAANPQARVFTIEGSPAIADIATANFRELGLKNIELITGNFDDKLSELLDLAGKVDLAFIDGNHRMMPTLDYFNRLLAYAHDRSIIVLDDIHWSGEMEQAWEQVKSDPRVRLTVDLFFIGIVFLRKDFKAKQHFSIQF